jgi:surfactin synthase thioesterase subunit
MVLTQQRIDAWLRPVTDCPADDAASLICFPHAGGSARYYFPLMGSLNSMNVAVVQYPGRDDRRLESPVASIPVLADEIAGAILDGPPRTRLGLFGHSMGALVAFEVAVRLGGAGWPPEHLFVSASPAPSCARGGRSRPRTDGEIAAELALLGGCSHDAAIEGALLSIIMPVLRNDFQAVEAYRPGTGLALDCPVTALIGSADPRTSSRQARAWSSVTTGRFALRLFAGHHFYINEQAAQVTDVIQRELGAGRPAGSGPVAPLPR